MSINHVCSASHPKYASRYEHLQCSQSPLRKLHKKLPVFDTAPEEVIPASYLYTLYTTQEKKWDFKEKKKQIYQLLHYLSSKIKKKWKCTSGQDQLVLQTKIRLF